MTRVVSFRSFPSASHAAPEAKSFALLAGTNGSSAGCA